MVSVSAMQSETTTKGHLASASPTRPASGMLTAGLVAITQMALMRPSWTASNMSTALRPGLGEVCGAPQKRATRATSSGAKSIWPARVLAMPPVSRPPMALGWPVIENGQAPGLPILPVARCALRIARPLATPCADWLAPMENRLTVFGVCANSWKTVSRSFRGNPQSAATAAGDWSALASSASTLAKPLTCSAMKLRSTAPRRMRSASRPFHSRTSICGARGRCRSATSAVSVRRGSMTTCFWPRARWASMRRNSTGWVQAALWPLNTTRSARSRSS